MNPFNRFGFIFCLMSVPAFFSLGNVSHAESIDYSVIIDLPVVAPTSLGNDDDQIRKIALRQLEKLHQQNQRTLRQQRKQVATASNKLEDAIADAIAKEIIETRSSVVGHNEEYIGEGMSERTQIAKDSAPDYPYYKVPKTHKDLYDADVQLQQTRARQAAIAHYQEDVDALVSAIRRRKNAAAATSSDKEWIQQQVSDLIRERL